MHADGRQTNKQIDKLNPVWIEAINSALNCRNVTAYKIIAIITNLKELGISCSRRVARTVHGLLILCSAFGVVAYEFFIDVQRFFVWMISRPRFVTRLAARDAAGAARCIGLWKSGNPMFVCGGGRQVAPRLRAGQGHARC